MSRICEICGKGYLKAKLVPRGVGNRVTKRTTIHRMANLRVKRFLIDGVKVKFLLCAGCLKRLNRDSALAVKATEAKKATAK
jgi:ribosomal protein L28